MPLEDLRSLSEMLVKGLEIREKYMQVSNQRFPSYVKRFLASKNGTQEKFLTPGTSVTKNKVSISGKLFYNINNKSKYWIYYNILYVIYLKKKILQKDDR